VSAGRVVIVSGPSGVGKDTVIDAWAERNPLVERVVAATTRAPRQGEVDGVHYHFLSREEFEDRAGKDWFLEFKEVHSNYYGTPRMAVEQITTLGKIAILKIDVQGAEAVMKAMPDVTSIFLMPPSDAELEKRIRERGLDDAAVIEERLANARGEMAKASLYGHQVVNDDLGRCVDELEAIVKEERG
jgi:guanylate kinase